MSKKTFVVTENLLRSALSTAEARLAAANNEIRRLDEEGHSDSAEMRGTMQVVKICKQHIAQLWNVLYSG